MALCATRFGAYGNKGEWYYSIIDVIAIIVVFIPLAVWAYGRRIAR